MDDQPNTRPAPIDASGAYTNPYKVPYQNLGPALKARKENARPVTEAEMAALTPENVDKPLPALTPKQKAFVKCITVNQMSQLQAYLYAFHINGDDPRKRKIAAVKACELAKKPHIAPLLAHIKQKTKEAEEQGYDTHQLKMVAIGVVQQVAMDGKRDADRLKAAEMLGSIPGVNLWGKNVQAKEEKPVTTESRLLGLLERVTGVVKSDQIYDAEWSAVPKVPQPEALRKAQALMLEAKKSGGATEAAPPEVREDERTSIPQSVDDQSTPDDDLWQDPVDGDDEDDDKDGDEA